MNFSYLYERRQWYKLEQEGHWGPIPYCPMGTETKNNSHLLDCVHFKEMALRSLRRQFWMLEDLYLKGAEKGLIIASFPM